jgi:cell division protein ZipA
MDFTMKQWIIGIIVIVIIVIIVDGVRRMRNARRDSLHMSLDVKKTTSLHSDDDEDENYGSEFPNGGARMSQRNIDKKRIDQVKSQYNFGRDLAAQPPANMPVSGQRSFQHIDSMDGPSLRGLHPTQVDHQEALINSDQWVDSDVDDEEYYAEKWDDEFTDDRSDNVRLGDGYLEDGEPEDDFREAEISTENTVEDASDIVMQKKSTSPPPRAHEEPSQRAYQQPEQVPLNLEESVPMLMELVIEEDSASTEYQELNNEDDMGDIDVEAITAEDTLNREADKPDEVNIDEKSGKNSRQKSDQKSIDISQTQKLSQKAATIRSVGRSVKSVVPAVKNENDEPLDTHSANKPRYESKYFSKPTIEKPTEKTTSIEEVLVVNVKAPRGTLCQGSDLLQQILDNGLRYGAMSIFHRHAGEEGEGPVVFSMANMLKPGTFDLQDIESFSTAGVTLFLTLPVFDNHNMAAFDLMIATAKNIASGLGGELNDENRSVMTGQTIEHYRERIRDFSRRQQLEKKR